MGLLIGTVLFIYAFVPNAQEETDKWYAESSCMIMEKGFYHDGECVVYPEK